MLDQRQAPPPTRGFRFDNSISWGDVMMGGGIVMAGIMAFTVLQTRVSLAEERITTIGQGQTSVRSELQRHITEEEERRTQSRIEVREDLRVISEKLDRLMEQIHTR